CEWDDETGEVNGFHQFGYDGEDFIAFDLKTKTWIAPTRQAVITKHKWDRDGPYNDYWKNYHDQMCPEWLKKYVDYGRSSLLRTVTINTNQHPETDCTELPLYREVVWSSLLTCFITTGCDWFVVFCSTEKSSPLIAIIIAAVAVLALVIGAVGFFIYRKKSVKFLPQSKLNLFLLCFKS
ncbi:H-2 class I histocompatibility antigen, Q10 alpha chain-like, partial [Seriola dumerili]|uniref:H-2 class I histocompatibility antigen, Q10 alpha chain-like n=1 Tax=Seriola dumerili TaxID=41447 RepID=UPI000BBE8BC0